MLFVTTQAHLPGGARDVSDFDALPMSAAVRVSLAFVLVFTVRAVEEAYLGGGVAGALSPSATCTVP
jgi:hypothetical protein